jgi:hypothetical protein
MNMRSWHRAGRLVAFLCVATVAVTAVLVSSAAAKTKKIPSQHVLTFTPNGVQDVFDGVVSSKKAFCERGRSITLLRVVGDSSAPDAQVTTATTDSDGTWSHGFDSAAAGSYYAKAAKKVKKRHGHKQVCKKATSNTVVVPARVDADADGFTAAEGDCDDSDPNRNPAMPESDNAIDDNCDGDIDEGIDIDGDGFTPINGGDCDDFDSAVNPDATEVENGVDDNCDGAIDEGFDIDADGFTVSEGDCDDANPFVNPDAAEVDNTIDDDCNGQVDEGFDIDADGFTPAGGDCNDANANVNPGKPEQNNGIDDDCDGQIDEGFDADGDGFSTGQGDCDDTNANRHPGATEVLNTIDDDCDGQIDEGL